MIPFHSFLILAVALLSPVQHTNGYSSTSWRGACTQAPIGYKISRIDSVKNLYIIYATRNDSLFKIISLNQKANNCVSLKVNCTYALKLHSRFEGKYAIKPPGADFNVEYNYYGTFVSLERWRGINDLFTCDNLKGLCLCK